MNAYRIAPMARGAVCAAICALFFSAVPASAELKRQLDIVYTGVVTKNAQNTLVVANPDGTKSPYTGPLPQIEGLLGDTVTIKFSAPVPTREFFSFRPDQVPTDGLYRIYVSTADYEHPVTGFGFGATNLGQLDGAALTATYISRGYDTINTRQTMMIVYDLNTDSYSIQGGSYLSSTWLADGYKFDRATQTFIPCRYDCVPVGDLRANTASLTSSADNNTLTSSNIPVFLADPPQSIGSFFWEFFGSWNLPTFTASSSGGSTSGGSSSSGGTPIDVPEPGMLVLFGLAAAALPLRRRVNNQSKM